ncbi:MAG: deoxynucleoside kinase [Deltaproteobacteria bacterium]|nr:deoxynucleoside kinase [Deltaproteobacteria bacterium]
MVEPKYIAIEGPIGVGKTSLTNRLAEKFGFKPVYEEFEENPFLADFYSDRKGFAFQTQLFFLLSRYRQQEKLFQLDLFEQGLVSDYLFAKDRIFAHINLDDNEIILYEQIYKLLNARVLKPDLVIFLQASVDQLIKRIKKRGRSYEKNIDSHYLKDLSDAYNRFFFHYKESPLLVVNTNQMNLAGEDAPFNDLIREISNMRGGVRHLVRNM